MSETKEKAEKAFDHFIESYEAKYPKAAECLAKDRDVLLIFYDFPAEHWIHLRTTNPSDKRDAASVGINRRYIETFAHRIDCFRVLVILADGLAALGTKSGIPEARGYAGFPVSGKFENVVGPRFGINGVTFGPEGYWLTGDPINTGLRASRPYSTLIQELSH